MPATGCDIMVLKAALFLLVAISVLAILGRFRWPRIGRGGQATHCDRCGRPLIGKGPCACGGRA